jgi:Zn-dependent M16 (insulinase) family peptidase
MEEVVPLFYQVMEKQCEGENVSFDVGRMKNVIRRYRRRLLEASERRPTDAIVDGIIRNFVYGPRVGEKKDGGEVTPQDEMTALHADTDILPFLDEAETKLEDASYWQSLIKAFIMDRPMAAVLGKPSAAMATESSQKEKEREANQAAELGEEGLKNLADILQAAMVKNESPIPEDILTSLPVPDLEKVPSIPLFNARLFPSKDCLPLEITPESVRGVKTDDAAAIVARLKNEAEKVTAVPFHADFTHIESAFVFAAVGIDTTPLTSEQRLYLPILDEILFKLPATLDNGERLTKDEFVNQLEDQTVSFSCGVGLLGGSIPQMAYVSVQTENTEGDGLATALTWIKRVLYQTEITGEAVKTAVQRLISEIPPQVRSGPSVTATVVSELMFDSEKSNTVACNVLRQKPFLSKLFEKIGGKLGDDDDDMETEDEPSAPVDDSQVQDIVKELEKIRNVLFQPSNYHAFVAANLNTTPNAVDLIVNSLVYKSANALGRLIDNVAASSVRRPMKSEGNGAVCGLSAIESGFLNIMTPGIKPYDPNRPALLVAVEYLTALEGSSLFSLSLTNLSHYEFLSSSHFSLFLQVTFGLS